MKLEITPAARTKILEAQSKIGKCSLVACVGWVKGGIKVWTNAQGTETSTPIRAHWGLGFYEKDSVNGEQIADIGGIAVLEDDSLDGKTLDFQEGGFRVR
jgi:hypothetical protein